MIDLKIKGRGLRDLVKNYKRFSDDVVDQVTQETYEQSRKRIRVTKKGPDGKRWEKLDPETRRKKGNNRILFSSGKLFNSLSVSGNKVLAQNRYAAVHQFGSRKMSVPARPFMGVEENSSLKRKLKTLWKRSMK